MKKKDTSLRETIYSTIVEDILSGQLNAGEKLLESELADRFNVSRTPAREALFQLEKDGFISHKKNVGAVVKKISVEKVQEMLDVVSQLEGYATEKVAGNMLNSSDISHLLTLQKEMETLSIKKNYIQYQKVNLQFHNFFVQKCKNQTLLKIVSDLRRRVYRIVFEGLTIPVYIDHYLASHRKIINAIVEGDAFKAGNLMKAHVEESGRLLVKGIVRR